MNHRVSGTAAFTLEDCLNFGFRDAGLKICVALIEMAEGVTLPDRYLLRPPMSALTQAVGFIVTCDAAIGSYQRETVRESEQINIVNVLLHELRCSHQDALHEAVALRDQVTRLFVGLAERVAHRAEPDLLAYIRLLSHFISGNLDWCLSTPRYHGELGGYTVTPGAGLRADTPAAGTVDPAGLKPISWWWRVLDDPGLSTGP